MKKKYFLGERFKKLRLNADLTQENLGKRIGITKQHISKIEHNTCKPSNKVVQMYCKEFNVTPEYLTDVNNISSEYKNQVCAKSLGLSDTMINELIERQNNGTNRIGILNDIFEIGYGHKFLYCLFEFFAGDYTPYADSNGEFILVNKDDNKQEFYRVVTAETLNEILKYRFIKVLDEIKKEFERKKYTHYDFNIQPKDILSALKQTLEDSNIETLDYLNF